MGILCGELLESYVGISWSSTWGSLGALRGDLLEPYTGISWSRMRGTHMHSHVETACKMHLTTCVNPPLLQVIGVIYRSTPYLSDSTTGVSGRFFDFLVNVFGFAMPFPVCLHENLPVVVVALLGYIPPLLAISTAIAYAVW